MLRKALLLSSNAFSANILKAKNYEARGLGKLGLYVLGNCNLSLIISRWIIGCLTLGACVYRGKGLIVFGELGWSPANEQCLQTTSPLSTNAEHEKPNLYCLSTYWSILVLNYSEKTTRFQIQVQCVFAHPSPGLSLESINDIDL